MPIFESMETILTTKFRVPRGVLLRLVARSTYVGKVQQHTSLTHNPSYESVHGPVDDHAFAALTLFVAVTFPFFGDLLGFFGGFGFTPTSFFVSPHRFRLSM
jgi:hypothetical protein